MFRAIFSISATSCSVVIRWVYLHLILAVEVNNSAKVGCSVSIVLLLLHSNIPVKFVPV